APIELTFAQALAQAVDRAPMLAARRAQTVAAVEDARRAAALPDPQLSVGVANLPVTGSDALDFRADDMTMKEIGVMQAFPARAKRAARQASADRSVELADALAQGEALAVREATAQAWLALWAAQHELNALQALREQAASAVATAQARLRGGTGSATD